MSRTLTCNTVEHAHGQQAVLLCTEYIVFCATIAAFTLIVRLHFWTSGCEVVLLDT